MHRRRLFTLLPILIAAGFFSGCEAVNSQDRAARAAMLAAIAQEPEGDYYIARRYYKVDYKFWGWVRKPRQQWSTAKLVMLNEHAKLAPDRAAGKLGMDNNFEYKLFGDFSGETVYEPASNGFYPEFLLKGYEVLSETPANIYKTTQALDPKRRIIQQPY